MTNWFQIKSVLIGVVLLVCLCTSGYGLVGTVEERSSLTAVPVYVNERLACTGYMELGTAYLPLRSFCGELGLGAVVTWNPGGETMSVQLQQGGQSHVLTARVGDIYLYINDRIVYLQQPVRLYRGNVLVPARGLCDAFGAELTVGETMMLHIGQPEICASGNGVYDPADLKWLSHIINAEAGNQSLEGQICVGNVVLNRVKDERFPDTVEAVIFSPNQFCPVKSGTLYCTPDADAVAAAKLCLEGVNLAGESLYFVNPATGSTVWFRQNLTYAMTVGDHDFYY